MQIPKVLLVNDDPASRYALENLLLDAADQHLYELITTAAGKQALRRVLLNQDLRDLERANAESASRCGSSTWIDSSRSTTPMAMKPATNCCAGGVLAPCGARTAAGLRRLPGRFATPAAAGLIQPTAINETTLPSNEEQISHE